MNQFGRDPAKFCEGKAQLDSREKKVALRKMRAYGITNIQYYRCTNCGWWHIGGYRPGKVKG